MKRALELADRGVAEAKGRGVEHTLSSLSVRADVYRKRGEFEAAERDLREGIAIIEDMRAKTIPMDFMKRGFTDLHQTLFAESIELLSQQGRWQLALETAEQARARAFLDLLASRDGAQQARATPPVSALPRPLRRRGRSRGCSLRRSPMRSHR